jgi:predicted alpha/beta superfamily hydrolase
MGGLMTIYALMAYNDTISRGAALSPSLDFDPERVKAMIREARIAKTVLYMDMGQQELKSRSSRKTYADVTARLLRKGVLLDSRIVPDGFHSEASWERQIPFFMDTLFYNMEE